MLDVSFQGATSIPKPSNTQITHRACCESGSWIVVVARTRIVVGVGDREVDRGSVGMDVVRCPSGGSEGGLVGGDPVDQGSYEHLAPGGPVRPAGREVG